MLERSLKILEYDRILRTIRDFAVSPIAKERALALRPMTDKTQIEHELDRTEEAFNVLMKNSAFHIGSVPDVSEAISLSKIGAPLSMVMLLNVAKAARTMRMVKSSIKNMQNDKFHTPILVEKIEFIGKFKKLEEDIFAAIISEDEMSDNASPALARIRRSIESKKDTIRKKLEDMISSDDMNKFLQDNLVTLRGDRFVIPVKSEHKSKVAGLVHDKSRGGGTFYIEPEIVVSLNNDLKSLYIDEREEIERIIRVLSAEVAEVVEELDSSYDVLCDIDFIFAKAKLAHKYNSFKPEISEEQEVFIKKGRHPLIEAKSVVPLDFKIGGEYSAVIITGPNTGGKTVALKTIGLFTALALSGNFVPATSSRFGIYNHILADIGDEQSIDQSLSTFSSHMKNIVDMLKISDDNALLLFDELGAGTDPTEGAALAISILNRVKTYGATVVATTHYSELKHFALVTEGFVNASVEFDVDKLAPTYKLSIGVPGMSNAFEISRRLGLSNDIIEEAKNSIETSDIEFEKVLSAIEQSKSETEKDRDEIKRKLLEISKKEEKINQKAEKLDRQRDRILNDAKEEASRLIKEARHIFDETLKTAKHITSPDSKEVLLMKQKLTKEENKNKKTYSASNVENRKKATEYKIGADYFVESLNQKAALIEISKDGKMAKVKAGIISSYVDIDELYMVENKKLKKSKNSIFVAKNVGSGGTRLSASRSSSMEIDLHGKDALQAIHEVDKFLDEALLSGLDNIRVIHGIGSGTLKREIRKHLKTLPFVKGYRDGGEREGGSGVTVVKFK